MKAQSAIEYLMTYGWMLVVAGIVLGVVAQITDSGCNIETSDFYGSDLVIEDQAVTSGNQLQFAFRNYGSNEVTVRSVEIGGEDSVVQGLDLLLEPGETRAYAVAETEDSQGCAELDMAITYDIGPVTGQKLSGTIQLPVELIEAAIELLDRGGGEIEQLTIEAGIQPINENICIGDNCGDLEIEETGENVSRSGDEMQGPLKVTDLWLECIGDQCGEGVEELEGYVSNQNNTMDGTLELEELRPIHKELVIGFSGEN